MARALADPGGQQRSLSEHCEAAARLGTHLGLGDDVRLALGHAYERWDGKGYPAGLAGEETPLAVRVVSAARDAELWSREGWATAAVMLDRRRGRAHDPAVVDALLTDGERWLAEIGDDPCSAVLDAEPAPVHMIDDLDQALTALAHFTDLKSRYFRGHSTGVARLAADAARCAGLAETDADALGRAALVHDVGRVGVPSGIWDRTRPLSGSDWERVRLHPYLTERVLDRCGLSNRSCRSPCIITSESTVPGITAGCREISSPSPLGCWPPPMPSTRWAKSRAHRPALTAEDAAGCLLDDVDGGRFARAEVDAVLGAAGQLPRLPNVPRPAGLTEREVDVLRLIARGHVNKQVAAELGISPKTVGHHVEHIYAKAGVTTRAGAALFAMENGLLTR